MKQRLLLLFTPIFLKKFILFLVLMEMGITGLESVFAQTVPSAHCCQKVWGNTNFGPDTYGTTYDASGPGTLFVGEGASILGVNPADGSSYGTMPLPAGAVTDINAGMAMGIANSQYLYAEDNMVVRKIHVPGWTLAATYSIGEYLAAIAVDGNNSDDLYVAGNSGTVYKITQGNNTVTPLTLNLESQTAGSGPSGIEVEDPGAGGTVTLYESYVYSGAVYQYTQNPPGSTTFEFVKSETLGNGIAAPRQMTEDGSGNIYLAEENGGYEVFDKNFNSAGMSCDNTVVPAAMSVAVDPQGGVYLGSQLDNGALVKEECSVYPGNNPPASGECFIYPSPASGNQATVSYDMGESGTMLLKIWNHQGGLVTEIKDQKSAGVQVTSFDISGLGSGVYFYNVTLQYDSGAVLKLKTGEFAVVH